MKKAYSDAKIELILLGLNDDIITKSRLDVDPVDPESLPEGALPVDYLIQ